MRHCNEAATSVGTGNEKYKLLYSGTFTTSIGDGILACHDIVQNVVEVERHDDRIKKVKPLLRSSIYNVFSVYTAQGGCTDTEKEEIWKKLEDLVSVLPEQDGIIVAGDLKGQVGQSTSGYEP